MFTYSMLQQFNFSFIIGIYLLFFFVIVDITTKELRKPKKNRKQSFLVCFLLITYQIALNYWSSIKSTSDKSSLQRLSFFT